MKTNKFFATIALIALALAPAFPVAASVNDPDKDAEAAQSARVRVPVNLAVLIQDDLVPRVANEIEGTRRFIRSLPAGSRVMVAYVTTGSLRVRQDFTDDLERAAKSLRTPLGNSAAAPFNPYVEVREALKKFPDDGRNANALLLVSDGLDSSRGLDFTSSVKSIDLDRASREAQRRGVAVYAFYAPTQLTAANRSAASLGQGALNRLARETGGRAFFQGYDFVSFAPYFRDFSHTLNRQFGAAG